MRPGSRRLALALPAFHMSLISTCTFLDYHYD